MASETATACGGRRAVACDVAGGEAPEAQTAVPDFNRFGVRMKPREDGAFDDWVVTLACRALRGGWG